MAQFLSGEWLNFSAVRPGSNKYLVLEGNRRLTAIKTLLRDSHSLPAPVLESVNSIRVYEFVYNDKSHYTRDEVIFELLGMIHLKGQLEWGAMERAHYIYKAYLSELNKKYYFEEPFYDAECCRICGNACDTKPYDIRTELATYLVYVQLKKEGYLIREEHYTLLKMAVGTQLLNTEYFELNWEDLNFSAYGLERFSNLCLADAKIVHNPPEFNKIIKIFKKGSPSHMALVESGEYLLDDIIDLVEQQQEKNQFYSELEKIGRKLSKIRLITPRRFKKKEERLVKRIINQTKAILRMIEG